MSDRILPALRYCLPRVRNRGHGLGNEMIPWARAYLASELLGARLLPPAFGMNRRGYWRHFRSPPDDWLGHRALEALWPSIEFTEADYLAHGGGDVRTALRGFAAEHRLLERRVYVLVTDDLWGGYHHIQGARAFVRRTLEQSRFAARNLRILQRRLDPGRLTVGMHVRLGDFAPAQPGADYRRAYSVALPLAWYQNIARSLQRAWGDRWQLLLVSDGERAQLQPLLDEFPCVISADLADGDCSDALALANADLLVCSASSYSIMAAFLSDAPYLWFAPALERHREGCYAIHVDADGHGAEAARPTRLAIDYFQQLPAAERAAIARGVPIDLDGRIPEALFDAIAQRRRWDRWELDLVLRGVAPLL